MSEDSASGRARLPPLRWALALVWRAAPGLATVSLAMVLLQSLLPAAILLMVKQVVDSIASQATTGEGVLDEPLLLVGVIGVLGILGAALQAADGYASQALGLRLTDRVQDLIHERSISLDLAYFEAADYHDHLHRAQRAGAHRPARVLDGLTALARSLFTALAVGGVLAMFEPRIVLGLAAAAAPGLAVRLRHSRRLFRWWQLRSAVERLAMLYDSMITNLAFAKELRLLGLGRHLKRRHAELRDTVREERLDLARRRAVGDVATHAMAALVMFVCLVVIVLRVGRQAATVGELVMCYQALVLLLASARQVLGAAASLYEDRLFIGHLREFLEQRPRIVDPAAPRALRLPLREGIAFDAVTFRYPGSDVPALEDVSIELRAGEITALVGENGAGKTTLVKLLCRLYDPDAGRVLLDGVDVRELRVEHLRGAIGVVFQDYARFPLSARENVAVGGGGRLEDATRLEDSARQAGADEIVSHLAQGYDTPLSKSFEGGHDLSDGQWQRLALARSYFKDASILALDEPTAALDALAEADLHARLRALARGRTTLLISHRFSTLSMADRIVVLERGRVAEQGTHAELVRRAGVYAKLYSAQAGLYPAAQTAPASGRKR